MRSSMTRASVLFVSGSRAEVPLVGKLNLGKARCESPARSTAFSVTQSAVLIGDFKTNRAAAPIDDVSPAYVRQLALYRALLQKIYPEACPRRADLDRNP